MVFAGDAVVVHPLPPGGSVSIGRSSENGICINHASVSRRHAVLHLDPPLRIEDLGGTNPISVRAARADQARLPIETGKTEDMRQVSGQTIEIAPGDCITLGSALIVVRLAEAAVSAPPAGPGRPAAPPDGGDLVLRDPAMRALYEQASLAAPGLISVLLLGETGTGKEVLARAIHRRSSPARARGPFLGLNCAALSETLLESELFGHEKGAFTGALQAKPGLFEAADGGTVFLDEVGELPKATQVKLLRVLEERQVLRVGGRAPRSIGPRRVSPPHRSSPHPSHRVSQALPRRAARPLPVEPTFRVVCVVDHAAARAVRHPDRARRPTGPRRIDGPPRAPRPRRGRRRRPRPRARHRRSVRAPRPARRGRHGRRVARPGPRGGRGGRRQGPPRRRVVRAGRGGALPP
ncbi:sigma-54-dependent Fis family transcriptional regulator [Sorangium sp. So ce296]|uniref:FHA domain-containing protein n=1 Tax=Sorangium sp. So ce296 TaxID=3133296 RepID=UPI003F62BF63